MYMFTTFFDDEHETVNVLAILAIIPIVNYLKTLVHVAVSHVMRRG